ncbi:hypothetical protein AC579_7333 [Pseudocercospora musae]|uniref:Uncharacterized protein n=1 Tax=Pseudocercospora musae TaxID=113226 RepID=A0A139GVQ0_9PEZI|nr:hypothetical protein AC579_7333 [Pseudocercospora musae]
MFDSKLGDLRGQNAILAVFLVDFVFTAGALALFFGPALLKQIQNTSAKEDRSSMGRPCPTWKQMGQSSKAQAMASMSNSLRPNSGNADFLSLTDQEQALIQNHGQRKHTETIAVEMRGDVLVQHRRFPQAEDEPNLDRREAASQVTSLRALQESIEAQRKAAATLEQALSFLQNTDGPVVWDYVAT